MGQYYMPTLIAENGTVSTLYSHQYDNGLKHMEHSYIGNRFVNAVLTQLWKHPMKVAWIGDYSDGIGGDPYEAKLPYEEFMRYYGIAWGKDEQDYRIHPKARCVVGLDSHAFLVNHTQKCCIDLAGYIRLNKWTTAGSWNNGVFDPNDTWEMCINPLPLLTACGNGRGGGDYHDCYPDYDKVGTWAFDLIECTDVCPEGYAQYEPCFTEQREAA